MLIITLSTKLRGGSICKDALFPVYHNNYLLCSAHHLFDEIPKRKLQLFRSLSNGSTACNFKRKSHDQEWNNIFVREHGRRGNPHEALEHFCRMNVSGTKHTKFNFCTALSSCAKTLSLHLGMQIHALIILVGYEENMFLNSALVDLYAKCDAMADARRVFECMERHDHVSWTSIIHGFVQTGCGREAILLFRDMLGTQIKPNCFTYVSVISACSKLEEPLKQSSLLHAHVIKLGFEDNNFVASTMIDCYSKCGRIVQAALLFDATKERDNIIINSMITGYAQNLYGEEALRLFMEMMSDNIIPTDHTLTSILNACGSLTVLRQGKQVHSLVIKMGSENNVFVVSALIDMYSKCGSIDESRCVFDETVEKNGVLWTSMIMAYAQSGRASDGLELFEYLVTKVGFMPDHVCFTAVLTACNHAGLVDRGIEYFAKMRRDYGLVPELDQYSCLIDLYARTGHLRKAKELMEEMPFDPNSVMWSSILSSCRDYGEVELGKEAADQLFQMEPCNAAHYVTLANLYAKASLWDRAAETRKLMKDKGTKKKTGWSWVEVNKRVHMFSVDDAYHPKSHEIYLELKKLTLEMKYLMPMPKQICELQDIDENVINRGLKLVASLMS